MTVPALDLQARSTGLLAKLTAKEREVLDLVLQHRTTKEIARQLAIAPNTVDMRLRSARAKLAARDRNDIARLYGELLASCGKTTCGRTVMGEMPSAPIATLPEQPIGRFTLNDAATFVPPPWRKSDPPELSEALDRRFGRLWRIAAIPLGSLSLVLVALALMAIAQMLGTLI